MHSDRHQVLCRVPCSLRGRVFSRLGNFLGWIPFLLMDRYGTPSQRFVSQIAKGAESGRQFARVARTADLASLSLWLYLYH